MVHSIAAVRPEGSSLTAAFHWLGGSDVPEPFFLALAISQHFGRMKKPIKIVLDPRVSV